MSDEKRVSKYLKYSEQEDIDNYENEQRQYEDAIVKLEEKEQQYYEDTLELIKKALISFVDDKSYTICEYLTTDSIDNFLAKNAMF
jgi:predicted transcriptional regulator